VAQPGFIVFLFVTLFCGVLFLCSRRMFVFVVMATLYNMADHYIFARWFLLIFFSSPNLSCRMVWP